MGVFERLIERFPSFAPDRIANILRENNGHAGQAAAALRDLSGTAMRPVDPDDAEHVRTLLSSPVMFSHACKEMFRKHDVNGDGVLQWTEILALVNSLYENFGLEPPREGGLKAFFEATDANGDGVLSEKEFKRFFEMFLRYAFFDVVNQQEQQPQVQPLYDEEEESPPPRPAASPQQRERASQRLHVPEEGGHGERRQARASPTASENRPSRRAPDGSPTGEARQSAAALDLEEPPAEGRSKGRKRHEDKSPSALAAGAVLRCVAGHGVTYRRSPEYGDRADSMVQKGEEIQVLEQWIRTPKGWLPLLDKNGQVSFEPVQEPSLGRATSDGERKAQGYPPDARSHKSSSSTGASRRSKNSGAEEADAQRRLSRSESGAAGLPMASPTMSGERRPGSRTMAEAEPGPPPQAGGGGGGLRPEEEEWRPRWLRLQERFPTATPDDVAMALRDAGGHAGQAASTLRALTST